jgi:hypothetical protein
MINQDKQHEPALATDHTSIERWTSSAYRIRFGQIAFVYPEPDQEAAFRVSAWGISENLRYLLADYSDEHIRQTAEWLTIQQNTLVADVLDQVQNDPYLVEDGIPPLEHIFISFNSEMYLKGGLRLSVICVTNIVPYGQPTAGLDKFVALLDPGEAKTYIRERRGSAGIQDGERLH